MGKLTIVVEDVPKATRALKNSDLYQEVADAFVALPMNKSFTISNEDIASTSLETRIRGLVVLKEGERMKISKIKGADGKLTAVRISKVAAPKPKAAEAEPQGEAEEA